MGRTQSGLGRTQSGRPREDWGDPEEEVHCLHKHYSNLSRSLVHWISKQKEYMHIGASIATTELALNIYFH